MGQQPSRGDSPSPEESEMLLPVNPEDVDHDGCFPPHGIHDVCPANPYTDLPVYTTIHRIRHDVITAIDDPYSLDQLRDPRMNVAIVRPLVDTFYGLKDISIIFCLLVNRAQFQREQLTQPHRSSVCTTRALLCELIATRILRRFHEDNPGTRGLLMLAHILVSGFDPFQGVPEESAREHGIDAWTSSSRTSHNRKVPALEIAIITESKTFLSSSACQRVVNAIFEGQVVYTPTTFIDILPDHYKRKPISLYNPRSAPLLNQYRLCVPRTRNILEICHFIVLLTLFLFIMAERDPSVVSIREIVFIIYTLGWVLDQTGSILEHGWHVYTQNLWSFLDVTFSVIFGIYLVLRIHGWRAGNLAQGQQALDVLAMGAPVLVPRLAFNLMSENMLFISLREMMRDFTVLTMLAVWCFAGFLLSMTWLSNGAHRPITISKWMLWVWFGLDGTGIQRSVEFHPILGPMLMVGFALLGNTLFLTILVSMLSTTFSTIVANATAEIHFRRAVLTLEGVKSDALFAYQPPLNILALLTLLPLKMMISPRWFHKINVAAVRTLNAPLLLLIGLIERRTLWAHTRRPSDVEQLPKSTSRLRFWNFSHGLTAHGDIEAVFDTEPPQEIEELIENEDDSGGRNGLQREFGTAVDASQQGMQNGGGDGRGRKEREDAKGKVRPRRRDSMYPFGEPTDRMRPTDSGSDEEEDEDMRERLQALEESTRRIEKMLETLCIGLAEPPSNRSGSNLAGETGTWRDLDRSASTAIED